MSVEGQFHMKLQDGKFIIQTSLRIGKVDTASYDFQKDSDWNLNLITQWMAREGRKYITRLLRMYKFILG